MVPEPLALVDVHYFERGARSAALVSRHWGDDTAIEARTAWLEQVAPYVPGEFYRRELPAVLAVLALIQTPISAIVVDGYVQLDEQGKPGLGGHLYTHFGGRYPVIGIAKTAYRGSTFAVHVARGESARPLFVTCLGLDPQDAGRLVASMHGAHRRPTLLTAVDHLARTGEP